MSMCIAYDKVTDIIKVVLGDTSYHEYKCNWLTAALFFHLSFSLLGYTESCTMVEGGIQISQSLILQLVGDDEKLKKKTKKTKPRLPNESHPPQKHASNEPETKGTPSSNWPLQAPLFLSTPQLPASSNPELESIRSVLKESESVLEKLKKHEENMVKEVTERAKELHEKEFKLPQQKKVFCEIERDSCVECYKEYAKDPLTCSTFVRSYQECVRRARKQQAQVPNS
ncbi:hypothetical protein KSS87_021609 [Heliosperma pusillum]|nr:hypothetical protein KSS87_021609 [Heliosperma pusillum]